MRGVCFFGGYIENYPRSAVLRKGLEKLGVPVSSCRVHHKKRLPARYAALIAAYLRSNRDFSVIYVPEFRHKDVPLAWLIGKLSGKKVVFDPLVSRYDTKVHDRGDAPERSVQAWHNRNLDRLSLALPDLVLADTQAHADYYISELGASPAKVRILPVGVDEELFKPKAAGQGMESNDGHRRAATKVLFFGNYLPLHGVPTIVRAANLLRARQDIEFELLGGGQTFPEVEALVLREQADNIHLLPRIPIESLPDKISSATFCLGIFGQTDKASRVVPNKVYQCMAMAKAVITARSPAMLERFADDDSLCLVPPGDAQALADKIVHLADHAEERERIAARAHQLVHEQYSSEKIAGLLLTYLHEDSRAAGRSGDR
ncbi:MAG: glycosyltransferase family 4 protein [Candidatus Latescibacterota bacterium]